MKRLQKNKSIAQKQEYLSVVDMTMQHQKEKEKMHEYFKYKKDAEPATYEEIKEHKRIIFVNSVDHETQ